MPGVAHPQLGINGDRGDPQESRELEGSAARVFPGRLGPGETVEVPGLIWDQLQVLKLNL